jgi:maltooligosyltrehalose synthase
VSFARMRGEEWIIVIGPRLSGRVGFPPVGDRWQDTFVDIPQNISLENSREIFTNREIQARDRQLRIGDALSTLPFAVLTNCGP